MARPVDVRERFRRVRSGSSVPGSVAPMVIAVAIAACSAGQGAASSSIAPRSSAASSTVVLDIVEAPAAAVAGCELLRVWVNAAVEQINQASAAAADASTPAGVRSAFLDALAEVESVLRSWPAQVEAGIPGTSRSVTAFRADLTRRSSEALDVLGEMRTRIEAWPDDDSETRNARTQQAFIWFEGVMAEMKPDLGPYEGTQLGRGLATAEECRLTIRR